MADQYNIFQPWEARESKTDLYPYHINATCQGPVIWPIGQPNDNVTSNQALEPKDLAFLDSERALSICVEDVGVFTCDVLILGQL